MKTLVNKSNGHQIRNNPGMSSYFQGGYRDYGRYAWNIKFYGFEDQSEIETALQWGFGEHVMLSKSRNGGGHRRGFETISELLGRPVESYTAGRSGGWLVIDTELSESELQKIDKHVASVMDGLADFLKEERALRKHEADLAENARRDREAELKANPVVNEAVAMLESVAGEDMVITLQGIQIK